MSALLNMLREQRNNLASRISALEEESKPVRAQLANLDRQRQKLFNEKADVEAKIKPLEAEPSVSDHAVIRYLERKHGFTFEDVRKEMLTDTVVSAMRCNMPSVKAMGGTMKLVGSKIVTFAP